MVALLWKVNLPAGRCSAVSHYGTYLVAADETKRFWRVEFTDFPTDVSVCVLPRSPKGRFATWEAACLACAKHADACADVPVLLRA